MTDLIKKMSVAVLIIFLISEAVGCGPMANKFTRKKKEKEAPPVYYELEKYTRDSNLVIYKRHYLYWKTWQEELINKLGGNRSKDIRCIEEAISNLRDMKKVLKPEKAEGLEVHIGEMEGLKEKISAKFITLATKNRLVSVLEKKYREIKMDFSPKKVNDFILPDENTD